MNVFEDLVIELQEENLLEETVVGVRREAFDQSFELEVTEIPNRKEPETSVVEPKIEVETATAPTAAAAEQPVVAEAVAADQNPPQNQKQRKGKEFFKKRAMTEVSSLQMVEHVLTGVEREYLKILPKSYDDFKAKKALNTFLQIPDSVNSEEHAQAEFELLQETEAWCSALAARDKNVSAAVLRQFCEHTKPALSSQAMLAAARFYRNLPYSESVRAKFDFVLTRLFSRPNEHDERIALFNREETLNHIKTLYADWASVPLYSTKDDDSDVLMAALSFDDLAVESENAASFDDLIKSDFFGRLRTFKESLSELFFAPTVTAAAVDANVRIGNSYVKLIARERHRLDGDSLEAKFSGIDESAFSDATARTLALVDLLKTPLPASVAEFDHSPPVSAHPWTQSAAETVVERRPEPKKERKPNALVEQVKEQIRGFNKIVLAFCALLVVATVGLVIWSDYFAVTPVSNSGVVSVDFENTMIHEQVAKARVSGGMLYVQLNPTWDALPKERRLEILKAMYDAGMSKGYNQVNLVSSGGKMVGFASSTRLEVVLQ